jgi:hypothetical protein
MTVYCDVAPEQLAKLFFHYREALAPDFACAPERYGAGGCWESAGGNERSLMVATAKLVLMELASSARRSQAAENCDSETNQTGNYRVEGSEGKECGC